MIINMFLIRVLLSTVFSLQFHAILAQENDDPSAALLVDFEKGRWGSWRNLVCIAKGNASSSALTFFSESSTKVDQTYDYGLTAINEKYTGWYDTDPFTTVVGKYPLLDFRWEGLMVYFTQLREELSYPLPAFKANWTLNVSVKGLSNCLIHLCTESHTRSSCYSFILGGWENKQSTVRISMNGQHKDMDKKEGGLDTNHWNHVTFEKNENNVTLRMGELILDVETKFDVKHMIFSTNKYSKGLSWRIHDRKFKSTTVKENCIESKWISLENNSVCISFFYYIPSTVQNAKLFIHFYNQMNSLFYSEDISNTEEDESRGWQRYQNTFNLTGIYVSSYVFLRIKASFDGDLSDEYPQDLFAIDDIKQCKLGGSVHMVKTSIEDENYLNLPTCQLLQFDSDLKSYTPENNNLGCPAGQLLPDCSVTCSGLFEQHHSDCDEVTICVPRSGRTICACSRGHQPPDCLSKYCMQECESGLFGDSCSHACGKCKYQRSCEWDTGVCRNGCMPGYATELCDKTFPKLNNKPTIRDALPSSLSFEVNFTDFSGYGMPTDYQIQCRMKAVGHDVGWRKIKSKQPVNVTDRVLIVPNLTKLTTYEIRVILFVNQSYYDGSDVPTVEGTTTCEDIQVDLKPNQTTIKVIWKWENTNLGCSLSDYSFRLYENGVCCQNQQFSGRFYLEFRVLEPYTEYAVEVKRSQNVLFKKQVWTLEAAPTEPSNLKPILISGSESTISWEHPIKPHGILTKFIVSAKKKETWLRNDTVPVITEDYIVTQKLLNYTYKVKGLYPSTLYVVSVSGMTCCLGPEATIELQTPLVEPIFSEQSTFKLINSTTSTADVSLPPASGYLTNTSAYVIIIGCKGCLQEGKSHITFPNETLWNDILNHSQLIDYDDRWIAGEIQPNVSEVNFTIGSNEKSKGYMFAKSYENRPLDVDTNYRVVLVAVNRQGKSTKVSALGLQPDPLNLRSIHSEDNEPLVGEGTSSVLIVAIILLILIPIVGFFIYKRKVFSSISRSQLAVKLTHERVEDNCLILKPPAPEPQSDAEEIYDCIQPLVERLSCRIAIEDLENYVTNGIRSGELQKQYQKFPRGQTQPWEYGKLPQNKSRNRYGNLVAYDNTRVILEKLQGDEYSDYINANYIDGYNTKKMYIATQGPKPNTIEDFWRMVWQEQIHIISMLANIMENGKKKCEQYWPDNEQEITYGKVNIVTENENVFVDFTVRNFKITCEGEVRKVVHLHFTSWPDHGVPFYPQSVAGYLKKLLAIPRGSGPILVHCSAGVGRTGTIILADICLRMAAAEKAVDVLHYLQIIREQRPNMVDNLEQYDFVHLILIECLIEDQTSYSCNGLGKHVQRIKEDGTVEKQFQRLEVLRAQNAQLTDSQSRLESTESPESHKNRFQDIVPGRTGRVYLSRNAVLENSSDYINAVYVDGFRIRDQFIVTQYPLSSTVGDFWRMVVEKNISLIVMLNDLELSESVQEFRPVNNESLTPMSHLKIKLKQKSHAHFWTLMKFQITDSSSNLGTAQHQIVRMIHLSGWNAGCDTPQEPNVLIHLWQEVEAHYSGKGPTLVMCLDGAKACGLFVASTFLIEKIKLEQQCDVCHAVRNIWKNRKQFIQSQKQFEFLYDVATSYLEEFAIYNNFD